MTSSNSANKVGCGLTVVILVLVVVLAANLKQVKSESISPNGHYRVLLVQQRVLQTGGGLDIRYVTDGKTVHTRHEIGDAYINFVEYAWSKDATRVGFFMGNMPSTGFAFDFSTGKEVPFEEMKRFVAEKIRTQYGLTATEDPFRCYKCTERFIKEHPSSVTY